MIVVEAPIAANVCWLATITVSPMGPVVDGMLFVPVEVAGTMPGRTGARPTAME